MAAPFGAISCVAFSLPKHKPPLSAYHGSTKPPVLMRHIGRPICPSLPPVVYPTCIFPEMMAITTKCDGHHNVLFAGSNESDRVWSLSILPRNLKSVIEDWIGRPMIDTSGNSDPSHSWLGACRLAASWLKWALAVAALLGSSAGAQQQTTGTVSAWGENFYGELGNGTTTTNAPFDVSTPATVGNLTDVVSVAGGAYHTLALKSDGTVWAWGANSYGELGDGTTTERVTPRAGSRSQ